MSTNNSDSMEYSEEWEDMANILFRQFKSVPPKIRDIIYEYTLAEECQILVADARWRDVLKRRKKISSRYNKSALLCVCRRIRNEATPIYYATNIFRAIISDDSSRSTPFSWIESLSATEREKVRKLVIEFRVNAETEAKLNTAILMTLLINAAATGPAMPPHPTLLAEVASIANRNVLAMTSREFMCMRDEGYFDLENISFAAGSQGEKWEDIAICWKDWLDQCLEGAKKWSRRGLVAFI